MQRKPSELGDSWVPIPPLHGDKLHNMTVLPYLEDYHYNRDKSEPMYYTEHDRNGN